MTRLALSALWSLSSWRAWIEMWGAGNISISNVSRSPHGERGLKSEPDPPAQCGMSRSPHGERGLK